MSRRMAITGWIGLILVTFGAAAAESDKGNWAERMFTEFGHDFGPVPRGAVVRHNFVMTNKYAETLTILDVRASCGCTSGKASATTVAPGQTASIEAQMDTKNFVGRKATKLTVTFMTSSGQSSEVQLAVVSNILPDIVLNPGSFDFGSIAKGQTPKMVMTIERVGQPNWKFEKMTASPGLLKMLDMKETKVEEIERSAARVAYRLTVVIRADTPAGYIRDDIRITTNDPSSPLVPVLVNARIQGTLTSSPSLLALGQATQGRYLVRSTRPFTVKAIEGAGEGFSLSVDDDKSKTMHVLTMNYDPKVSNVRGDLRRTFKVTTDLTDEAPVELQAALRVEP
jgi:hypothetical protein